MNITARHYRTGSEAHRPILCTKGLISVHQTSLDSPGQGRDKQRPNKNSVKRRAKWSSKGCSLHGPPTLLEDFLNNREGRPASIFWGYGPAANWFFGVLLGAVQGISEWLPISSKTQVIIASSALFGLSFKEGYAFGLFLEGGTFIAAVLYFRRQLLGVLKALVGKGTKEDWMLLKFLVIATAVTAVLGVLIYEAVSESVTGPALGIPMIALGCVLIGDGALITIARGARVPTKGLADLKNRDVIIIGIAQGIAAFPGVSRSGATVSTMLLMGVKPEDSFKLSFLALIPASIGAAGVSILFSKTSVSAVVNTLTPTVILIAIVTAIAIGLVSIRTLLRVAGSNRIAMLAFALGALAIFSGITSYYFGAG